MTMHTDRSIKQILEDWKAYQKGCFEDIQEDYVNIYYFNQLLTDLLRYIERLEKRVEILELKGALWG